MCIVYLMITVVKNFALHLWKLLVLMCQNKNPDFTLFSGDFKNRNCRSARCALVANTISMDLGIINGKSVLLNDLLH